MSTCDVQQLVSDGKCFSLSCLTHDQQRIVRLQLLCEIKQGGGGGGGVTRIIAGPGISVDQETGDVTVSTTTGNYVLIYSGATTSPQAHLWTVVDGTANQIGFDVYVTTGATSITIPSGVNLDGDFDLSPLNASLSQFIAKNGVNMAAFESGPASNLANLDLQSNPALVSVDMTGCTGPVDINVSSSVNLTTITLTGCTGLNSIVADGCTALTGVNVSGCTGMTYFQADSAGLTSLNFNGLAALTSIEVNGCPSLATISVTGCSGLLTIYAYGIPATALSLTGCTAIAGLFLLGAGFTSLDCTGKTALNNIEANGCAALASLTLTGCTALASLNVSATALSALNCTGLTALGIVDGSLCASLASVNLTGCSALASSDFNNCPSLATVTNTGLALLLNVNFSSCGVLVASVNSLLQALDANGLLSGTIDIAGGTSAAPTGAGITAAANLTGKSWNVVTN